jgi:hypothetical protein
MIESIEGGPSDVVLYGNFFDRRQTNTVLKGHAKPRDPTDSMDEIELYPAQSKRFEKKNSRMDERTAKFNGGCSS